MSAEMKAKVTGCVAKIQDKKEAVAALEELASLAKQGSQAAPFLVQALPKLMEATAHKEKKTKRSCVESLASLALAS